MTAHQSLALGFFIVIGLVVGVCGERFEVTSAQQLIKLLNISEANNFDANIVLLDNLDFSDISLTLPLGAFSDGTCVPYSGVFQGNGHSIKGLQMNSTKNEEFKHAGLFCSLKNATVENLVIDSSCSFTGVSAGALCVSVNGSVVVKNVTNKASIKGEKKVGGFIAYLEGLKQEALVSFEGCVNDGNVTVSGNYVGGFVGFFYCNSNMVMAIDNSINLGTVTGESYAGGFVGSIWTNTNMSVTLSNSINHGTAIVSDKYAGGFVGIIANISGMLMTISDSMNNGTISGNSNCVGGFAGFILSNTNMTVFISNFTNNGRLTGFDNYVGGFFAIIELNMGMTMTMTNYINNGVVSGSGECVGGFVGYFLSNINVTMTF